MQDSKYAVLLLSHDESSDSDRFKLMDSFPSIDECQGYIWRYDTAVLSSEDIFTICDIAYVSDVYNYAEGTYIVGEDLDAKEMSIARSDDHWGGSNVIGGSPRVGGSAMNPDMVAEVIGKVTNS